VTVANADETAEKVKQAGGTVVMAPMDVMTAGRMAVFQDPYGAFFSISQAGDHHGAQLINEPGSLSWNELNTHDTEGAAAFYAAVFGWKSSTTRAGRCPTPSSSWGARALPG
jgi:predicted enzyme related to lactoylglutathione lyase